MGELQVGVRVCSSLPSQTVVRTDKTTAHLTASALIVHCCRRIIVTLSFVVALIRLFTVAAPIDGVYVQLV